MVSVFTLVPPGCSTPPWSHVLGSQPFPDLRLCRDAAAADHLVIDDESRCGQDVERQDVVHVRDLDELGLDAGTGGGVARNGFELAAVGASGSQDFHGLHGCSPFSRLERGRWPFSQAIAAASTPANATRPIPIQMRIAPSTQAP